MTPAERRLRAQLGAYTLHATHNPQETTAKGRAAFLARFERQVDPEGKLPEGERKRRAESARKAHMTRLSLLAAQKRSAQANARKRSA